MKITKTQLKQIIKEELSRVQREISDREAREDARLAKQRDFHDRLKDRAAERGEEFLDRADNLFRQDREKTDARRERQGWTPENIHAGAPRDVWLKYSRPPAPVKIRMKMADHPDVPAGVLWLLSKDEDPAVAQAAKDNPSYPNVFRRFKNRLGFGFEE
jgi:hypothetical protein